jgi:integrase
VKVRTRSLPFRRLNRGAFILAKRGVWIIDLVYRGHRVRKRLGRGLPFEAVKQIAQREAVALRTSILLTGKPPAREPQVVDVTINAACDRFEREHFPVLRANTKRAYRRQMKPIRAHLGTVTFGALSPFHLEQFKRDRTRPTEGRAASGRTAVNRELTLLKGVYAKCVAWKLFSPRDDNPFDAVAPYPEPRGRERILTFEEEDRLLAALPERARTVARLALECGARLQSELLPVVWDDVDLDHARLLIRATDAKNGKPRHLPLSPGMVATLRTSAFVFPGRQGAFFHRYKHAFFQAVRTAGLAGTGVNIHCLRHSWASRMLEAGADLAVVRDLGGWADLAILNRYSHHRPQRAVDATGDAGPARRRWPARTHRRQRLGSLHESVGGSGLPVRGPARAREPALVSRSPQGRPRSPISPYRSPPVADQPPGSRDPDRLIPVHTTVSRRHRTPALSTSG